MTAQTVVITPMEQRSLQAARDRVAFAPVRRPVDRARRRLLAAIADPSTSGVTRERFMATWLLRIREEAARSSWPRIPIEVVR